MFLFNLLLPGCLTPPPVNEDLISAEQCQSMVDESIAALNIGALQEQLDETQTQLNELQIRLAEAESTLVSTLGRISVDTTLYVSEQAGDFPDIQAALDYLDGYAIDAPVTVTIFVRAGTYTYTSPITVAHPCGDKIEIVGEDLDGVSTTNEVILSFVGCNGVVVKEGNVLGLLQGVELQGDGVSADADGIQVSGNAYVVVGAGVAVTGFAQHGIWVNMGGVVSADETSTSDNVGAGYVATHGAYVHAVLSTSTGDKYGFFADSDAGIYAKSATATNTGGSSFWATRASFIDIEEAVSYNSGYDGLYIAGGSWADASEFTCSLQKKWGVEARFGGSAQLSSATITPEESGVYGATGYGDDPGDHLSTVRVPEGSYLLLSAP